MKPSLFSILVVASLSFSGLARADLHTWENYKGCYQTVTYNGNNTADPTEDFGTADAQDKFGFATMPSVPSIESFSFMLFKYAQNHTSYSDFAWIFPDYGNTEVSPDGKTKTWSFTGPMVCTGFCGGTPTDFTMNTKIEIQDIGNNQLQIHNFRSIVEMSDHSLDADDIYVIEKRTPCFMCETNPDGSISCSEHS